MIGYNLCLFCCALTVYYVKEKNGVYQTGISDNQGLSLFFSNAEYEIARKQEQLCKKRLKNSMNELSHFKGNSEFSVSSIECPRVKDGFTNLLKQVMEISFKPC